MFAPLVTGVFILMADVPRRCANLAKQVTASVGDVQTLLNDVRGAMAATATINEENAQRADGTAESARQISVHTEEQRAATALAQKSIRSVAEMIAQALGATQHIHEMAGALEDQADRLSGVVSRFQGRRP